MSNNRKGQESSAKILHDLAYIEENRFCFDCDQRGPTYVNMSIGSFVCTRCGGALRKYNQRVKSISMSNFNSQEINFLKRRGNKACGNMYLAFCDGKEPEERDNNLDDYLRLKYQVQKWYCNPDPSVEAEAFRINEEALTRAAQSPLPKVNLISSNAAAGLIILNNRCPPTRVTKLPDPNQISSEGPSTDVLSIAPSTPPILASNVSQQQPFSWSTTATPSEKNAGFVDPFAEFVTARPVAVVSEVVSPPSLAAQTTYNAPLQQVQPANQHSAVVFKLPTFSPPPSATATPSTSHLSTSSSHFVNSAFGSTFAPFDKYAALAELDRMEKNEEYSKLYRPSVAGSFSSSSITPMSPQQENMFGSSTCNPFQPQPLKPNNPFAVMNDPATAAVPSNTTSPEDGKLFCFPGQNSFNPFVNAQ